MASMPRVFVTGGLGRLGPFVVDELIKFGYGIRIFDIKSPEDPIPDRCDFIVGDLTLLSEVQEAVKNADVVVHLAAIPTETGEAEKIMKINVLGTFNVMEAASREKIRKIVFASSICAYGILFSTAQQKGLIPQFLPLDEDHPCKPDDSYGVSKLIGEQLCRAYSERYDMSVLCLRFASIIFEKSGMHVEFWRRCLGNIDHPEPDVNLTMKRFLWQYVDPRDAAQACRLALEKKGVKYGIYNIGAEDVFSKEPSLSLVEQYYPKLRNSIRNIGEYHDNRQKTLYDISKAKRELGYRPRFTWRDHM